MRSRSWIVHPSPAAVARTMADTCRLSPPLALGGGAAKPLRYRFCARCQLSPPLALGGWAAEPLDTSLSSSLLKQGQM